MSGFGHRLQLLLSARSRQFEPPIDVHWQRGEFLADRHGDEQSALSALLLVQGLVIPGNPRGHLGKRHKLEPVVVSILILNAIERQPEIGLRQLC